MKIGVFDSGYGGLTVLEKIRERLPQYDYIYMGDNARAPYGTRSFDVVYRYTWECVKRLFEMDCALVILACNTASAKALRSIQQNELMEHYPNRRVLGVIRPTAEVISSYSKTKHIGILATEGTVQSQSYLVEIHKVDEAISVAQQSCPMLVPIIENNEHNGEGADFFVEKYIRELLQQDSAIDTILLACTHYPLIMSKLARYTPKGITLMSQGEIVADSLADYLARHTEIEKLCSKQSNTIFFTTENADKFNSSATIFLNESIISETVGDI